MFDFEIMQILFSIFVALQIYNVVSNFKSSEFQQYIQDRLEQKRLIDFIQQYAISNLKIIQRVRIRYICFFGIEKLYLHDFLLIC